MKASMAFVASRCSAGSRTLQSLLHEEGIAIGRYKARRLLQEQGLACKQPGPHQYKVATDERIDIPNRLDRQLDVSPMRRGVVISPTLEQAATGATWPMSWICTDVKLLAGVYQASLMPTWLLKPWIQPMRAWINPGVCCFILIIETQYALNLGKTKEWYSVTMAHFQSWADRSDIPWRVIKPHLDDTMAKARDIWPEALHDLPMNEEHKKGLINHWQMLQDDFKIKIND